MSLNRVKYNRSVALFVLAISMLMLTAVSYEDDACADTAISTDFNILFFDTVPYISLVDLAETYNVRISFDPASLSMTAARSGKKLTLVNMSRIMVMDDAPKNIVLPARLVRGAMFAPARTFLPLFSELIPGMLMWDDTKRGVSIEGNTASVRKLGFENLQNGTIIRIALSEPLKYKVESSENNWLHVIVDDGSFNTDSLSTTLPSGLVREVRSLQYAGEARLSFLLSDELNSYNLSEATKPDEIAINLSKKRAIATATVSLDGPSSELMEPLTNDALWRIDTVIIDPGHGGKDPGAEGGKRTKEKDIVLKVALELKKIIDSHGEIKGVLTRDKDVAIPLYERGRIANREKGKLFICIHANGHKNKSASGSEIFFLSAAKTQDAMDVAKRENEAILFEENPEQYDIYSNETGLFADIMDIESEMAANVFLSESQDMCKIMIETTTAVTGKKSRGVKQAGLIVLKGTQATMPSVLFEIGFLTNAEEEKLMSRASYQRRLAQAIYDSIITFKRRHERGLFSRSD